MFDPAREARLDKVYESLKKPKLTGKETLVVLAFSLLVFVVATITTNYVYNAAAPLVGLAKLGISQTMLLSLAIHYLTNPRSIDELIALSEERKKQSFAEKLISSLCALVYYGITAGVVALLT